NNNLTLNKKLKKTGRTLSLNTTYNYNKNEGEGNLQGYNAFTIGGQLQNQDIDQKKQDSYLSHYASAKITYTEPLSKKWLLKTSYEFISDQSESGKETYEKTGGTGAYNDLIDSLSNVYSLKVMSHSMGADLKFNEKKYNVTVGGNAIYSLVDQHDEIRNRQYNYHRWNLFPNLRFNYKFDQFRRLQFSYSGSTRQPGITQVQPVQDNSNPLNVVVGNPSLKLAYNQNINLSYFSYKVLSGTSLYGGIYGGNTYNAISTSRIFDTLGRTITSYVNLNGNYNASVWGGISTKLFKSPLEGKLNLNGSLTRNPNIINSVEGFTHTQSITLTPGLAYNAEDKFYASIDLGTIYTNSTSQLQSSRNIRFFSFAPSASFIAYLPKNFELGTDADYQYNPPVGPYPNSFSRLIWNAHLDFKMLSNKNLEWSFRVNDMLNQNRGYERTTSNNYNTERYFQTLGRYWMVGMLYNFNTGPMAKQGNNGPKQPRMPRGGGRRMRVERR
ncbi:MAG TPA: TonB-dependent receptor, partial [Chitinophagaceae bacterium]|nr:TonB-dependent receptor [Chitinophagaceae bacterium]